MTKENIAQFVDDVLNKDNLSAETNFKTVMSDKVGDALEKQREVIAKTIVTNHVPATEEDDDIGVWICLWFIKRKRWT